MTIRSIFFVIVTLLSLMDSRLGYGQLHELPASFEAEALSDTTPFVFDHTNWTAKDFAIVWKSKPLPGVKFRLGENSLEWVRTADLIHTGRARLLVNVEGVEAGQVRHHQHTQPIVITENRGQTEVPVALVSGPKSVIFIKIRRGGRWLKGEAMIQFRPQSQSDSRRVFLDSNCSKFGVSVDSVGEKLGNTWVYIGCRFIWSLGDRHRTSTLELYTYWDNIGQTLNVNRVPTDSIRTSLWSLRVKSDPGYVMLQSGKRKLRVKYSVPEHKHLGYFGLGLGPYTYAVDSPTVRHRSVAPLLTLYGSYFLSEPMSIVMFDATALSQEFFTDFGVYLQIKQMEVFDSRFRMNLLLGAHTIVFQEGGSTFFRFSGPQGVELKFKDFIKPSYDVSFGGFFYPPINDQQYYNLWLRWGKGGYFGEFNYISWQEPLSNLRRVYSRSVGITFGMPIGGFL